MLTIETKELKISEELKRKFEMVCRFANVKYNLKNGNFKKLEYQNEKLQEENNRIHNIIHNIL